MAEETTYQPSPEVVMLQNNRESGFNYQERRHDPWKLNYELYRDEVIVNRLTQRQSVNIPLMKTTLRTLLKDVDDMSKVEFENLSNDKQAQAFLNGYWECTLTDNNAEIKDLVDKKQDFFFGRSFDSWNIVDGKVVWDIEDPQDMLVDRFMNPYDIDSSRFLIHDHIFKPLSEILGNPDYDQKAVDDLLAFYKTEDGIIKQQDNQNSLDAKNQKLTELGVPDMSDPLVGETIVELSIHYVFRNEYEGKEIDDQIIVYVLAENNFILSCKKQEDIIGVTKDHYWRNHYRYNTWGDDVDKQDFWTDGIADIVRTPNIVLNSWFSQEVENRTLRNYGMHYYDSSLLANGFSPNTFNPMPWGWYPVPGKPSDVFQKVDIPELGDNLQNMEFIKSFVESATGANAVQQGELAPSGTPLGEVQLAQGEAKARTQGISKYYNKVWEQRAFKFWKLIEAGRGKLDAVKIYMKGRNTDDIFEREVSSKDWMSEAGYRVKVWSKDEKDNNDKLKLEKQNAVKLNMPDNPVVDKIYKRNLVEWAGYTPDEITEVLDYEKQKPVMPMMPAQAPQTPPTPNMQPQMAGK